MQLWGKNWTFDHSWVHFLILLIKIYQTICWMNYKYITNKKKKTRKIVFKKNIFLSYQTIHKWTLNMERQVCLTKIVAYRAWIGRHADRHTDRPKSIKQEDLWFCLMVIPWDWWSNNLNSCKYIWNLTPTGKRSIPQLYITIKS